MSADIAALKALLDEEDTRLSLELRLVEQALDSARLGIRFGISFQHDETDHQLHWSKLNDRWRLFVDETPFESVNRDLRASAAMKLDDFMKQIPEQLEARIAQRRAARAVVVDALKTLAGSSSELG